MAFIRAEIGEGRPVISFGFIWPPEACIVTGCFATDRRRENPSAVMLRPIGEARGETPAATDILATALYILERERIGHPDGSAYHGGQAAYRAWSAAVLELLRLWRQGPGHPLAYPVPGPSRAKPV